MGGSTYEIMHLIIKCDVSMVMLGFVGSWTGFFMIKRIEDGKNKDIKCLERKDSPPRNYISKLDVELGFTFFFICIKHVSVKM